MKTVWQSAVVLGIPVDPLQHRGELSSVLGTFPDDRPLHETWLVRHGNGRGQPVNGRLHLYLFEGAGAVVWVLGVPLTLLDQRSDSGMSRGFYETAETFEIFTALALEANIRCLPRLMHFQYRTEVA